MFKLRCSAQNYAWGKAGVSSEVARLLADGRHVDKIDDKQPYAELWMGVHPNCPSRILADEGEKESELLSDRLHKHPELLGTHEQGTLQFLFKVLSVEKALSVQSHPTKEQARELHSSDPKNYPDPNHKPEMAIALTDFQLLCGFRPAQEIYDNISAFPPLFLLAGSERVEVLQTGADEKEKEAALRDIFTSIWSLPQEAVTKAVDECIKIIENKKSGHVPLSPLDELQLGLNKEFPGGDVGVFAPLFLNYFTLRPGQATFLGPNRPHAYLKGDCIECMACSDNTIRAGLTPKFKDIKTLCANLEYTMSGPPILQKEVPTGAVEHGGDTYAPPVEEFAVQQITEWTGSFLTAGACSLLLVICGDAILSAPAIAGGEPQSVKITRGDVIFIPASTPKVDIHAASTNTFHAWRAYTPRKG